MNRTNSVVDVHANQNPLVRFAGTYKRENQGKKKEKKIKRKREKKGKRKRKRDRNKEKEKEIDQRRSSRKLK